MLGHGRISHYSEYVVHVSSTLSIYSTLIAIVLRDYDAAFLYHCWFSFILWWAVDIQIWAPLTRSQLKVSDTQVTVKACGPLVKIKFLIWCVLFEVKMSVVNFSIIFHTYVPQYVLTFSKLLFDKLTFVQNVIWFLIECVLLHEYLFETL